MVPRSRSERGCAFEEGAVILYTGVPLPAPSLMPFSCHIASEQRIGVIRLYGGVSGDELIEAVKTLYSGDDWQPGFNILWDARAIAQLVLAPEDADAFTRAVGERIERIGRGRTAVVTTGFETYMSGLLLAIRSRKLSPREIEMFSDLAPALAWLGIDELPPALETTLCA